MSDSSDSQKRSDFGQFRSDSPDSPPSDFCSPGTLHAPCSMLSAPRSEPFSSSPLWSRQPDEPADAYQLFNAWLLLAVRRPVKQAAIKLGCSVNRIRQLSARYRWPTRTAAFDNHRANAASEALDRLLKVEELDWKQRAERFRQQEWLLHEQLFEVAEQAIQKFRKHIWRATLSDIAKMMELASILGRRAANMPVNPGIDPSPAKAPHDSQFEEHLRRIYGDKDESDTTGNEALSHETTSIDGNGY